MASIRGYNIVYSPDGGGYYGEVCNKEGKVLWNSPIYKTEGEVARVIAAKYSGCRLIKLDM